MCKRQFPRCHLDIPAPHALGTGCIHIPIVIPAHRHRPNQKGDTRERMEEEEEEIGLYAHQESEREGVESENEEIVSKNDHGRAYTVQVENLSNSEELVDNSEEEEEATPVKVQAKGKERERNQSREMDGPLEKRSLEDGDSNERAPSDMDEPFAVEIVENPRCMQTT